MDLKRFVMVDFSGSSLAWGVLVLFGLSNIYAFWFLSKVFGRKFHDPEWRKYADAWSWLGMSILAAGTLGATALVFAFVILNAAWYLTH